MNALKISWGKGIALLYISFVGLIIFLVYRSMNEDFDLVTKDYYGQEIKYQEVIDAGRNQAALSAPVRYSQKRQDVIITFPQEFRNVHMKGTIQFYSAVNAAWDKTFHLDVQDARVTISIAGMEPTFYTVKLKWSYNDKLYYQENTIKIPLDE